MKMIAVWTTVGTDEDARRIARLCVERRLAAFVQLSRIDSFYEWNGALQQDGEVRMVFKTTEAAYGPLEAALREMHPYELPAIFAFDVDRASPDYDAWVRGQTLGDHG